LGLTGQGDSHAWGAVACCHPDCWLLCGVACRVFSFRFRAAFGDFFVDKPRPLFYRMAAFFC
jgi:hypothetical protein